MSLYVDPGDLATTLKISSESQLDDDLELACFSASGAIDECCDTVFALSDSSNDEVRKYTAQGPGLCVIDDLASFTELRIDRFEQGTYSETWVEGRDFVLLPANAAAKGKPWNRVRARSRTALDFPKAELGVQISGRFGWLETPPEIVQAAGLLATQLIKRRLEAPFGIVSFGIDQPAALRVLRSDPHLLLMLEPFYRTAME